MNKEQQQVLDALDPPSAMELLKRHLWRVEKPPHKKMVVYCTRCRFQVDGIKPIPSVCNE